MLAPRLHYKLLLVFVMALAIRLINIKLSSSYLLAVKIKALDTIRVTGVIHQLSTSVSNRKLVGLDENSTMADYATISYVTTPNIDTARELAKSLIEKKLAACVNIIKSAGSIYEWDGKIENEDESMMIVKSLSSKTKLLTEFVEKHHPYKCPEVITVKVESGSVKYLQWIQSNLTQSSESHDKAPITTHESTETN